MMSVNSTELSVLVIDDNESIRKDLERSLGLRNVKVGTFATAEEILNHLTAIKEEDHPTALIVDLVLPDMSGEELLLHLLEHYPRLPIIVMSGLDIQRSWQTYSRGVYAVMQKPVDYNELKVILKELADTDDIFMQMAQDFRYLTKGVAAMVWKEDRGKHSYKVVGWNGVDRDYITNKVLDEKSYKGIHILKNNEPIIQFDLENAKGYRIKEEARNRGWQALICLPIIKDSHLLGWLEVYFNSEKSQDQKTNFEEELKSLQIFANQAGEVMYSRGVTQFLRIVQELNQNLAGTLQEKQLYQTILNKITQALGADYGWVYRYIGRKKIMQREAFVGENAGNSDLERVVSKSKGGIFGKVARTGRSLYVPNIEKPLSEGYRPEINIAIAGVEEKSTLVVPLRQGQRTLGVLAISSRMIDFFRPEDTLLITALAATVAISMERNKLTRHLQGISRLAQQKTPFEKLAEYVVNAVSDLTNAEVNLWMMSTLENEGDDYMRILATSNNRLAKEYIRDAKLPTEPGSCLNAEALNQGAYKIVSDLEKYNNEPPILNKVWMLENNWHSFMVVPLLGKNDEHLGVISLLSDEKGRFSEEDGILVRHFADQAALVLQEQRHITILQELAQIGQDLTFGASGAKPLLQKVVKLAKNIAKAELTALYPYDLNRQDYYDKGSVVYGGILRSKDKEINSKPRTDGLAAFIRQHGAVIVEAISDEKIEFKVGLEELKEYPSNSKEVENIERFIRESKFIDRENIQAFIGVSLQAVARKAVRPRKHQEVAILYFNFRAPRHFSRDELQVIDIFCHQVANVIHRYRLFDILQKEKDVIEAVHQSALAIQEGPNLTDRLQKIVDQAVNLLGARGGKIYLITNRDKQELSLKAGKKLPGEIETNIILPPGKGLAREVIRERRPIFLPDPQTDRPMYSEYQNRVPELSNLFSAVVEVPLFLKNEVIGVLGVFDDVEKRTFSKDDVEILERLAVQAALAIYNGQLYDELDALYQTGTEISKQSAPEIMGNKILEQLKRVIEYDKATIQVFDNVNTKREVLARNGYEPDAEADQFLLRPICEDKLVEPIIKSKKIQVVSNVEKNLFFDNTISSTKDIKSWVGIPLVYGNGVIGLMTLDHKEEGYYTKMDEPKLERFAIQAAIGIFNARLEQQHLQILGDFVKITSEEPADWDAENVVTEAFKMIDKALSENQIKVKYISLETEFIDVDHLASQGISVNKINRDDAIHRWVVENRKIFIQLRDFPYKLEMGHQKMVAPLLNDGSVQGMIELISINNSFRQNHKNFVRVIANLSSDCIFRINLKRRRRDAFEKRQNPYIVGRPIRKPNNFYGRKKELQSILDGIHQNNFIIESERRIGKTSVLFQLENHLKTREDNQLYYLPVFVNLEDTTNEKDFWLQLIDQLRFTLGLPRISMEQAYGFRDFRYDVKRLLNEQEENVVGKRLKVVFLMDEIDVFNHYSPQCLNQIRKIFNEEHRLQVVMAGVELKKDVSVEIVTSPWDNQLFPVRLEGFNREECFQLITEPAKGIYSYTTNAIEKIIEASEKKPYRIQQICYHALQSMLNRLKKDIPDLIYEIEVEDVEIALNNI